jgi:hypothetical protein
MDRVILQTLNISFPFFFLLLFFSSCRKRSSATMQVIRDGWSVRKYTSSEEKWKCDFWILHSGIVYGRDANSFTALCGTEVAASCVFVRCLGAVACRTRRTGEVRGVCLLPSSSVRHDGISCPEECGRADQGGVHRCSGLALLKAIERVELVTIKSQRTCPVSTSFAQRVVMLTETKAVSVVCQP